jgi:protein-ribulosamine 3-kinase
MINEANKLFIGEIIARSLNEKLTAILFKPVGGGSISRCYQVDFNGDRTFFCKINSASAYPSFFQAEKSGLQLIAEKQCLKTPEVIGCATSEDVQVLILQWIKPGERTAIFWRSFGEQMARLHRVTMEQEGSKTCFGLSRDNFMGALPQSNKPTGNWVDFFREQRLQPQILLARNNNLLDAGAINQFMVLFKNLPDIFPQSFPSFLHGDLWSGNFLCDQTGNPVLIDPAVYFGDRVMDLAMTKLFGGFDQQFYQAYAAQFAFPENFAQQCAICNLYPLLIHLNLFGRAYLPDILETIRRF